MTEAFISLRVLDILDIIMTAALLYWVYRLIRGTIAITIFAGIFSVYLFWLLVRALNMELLSSILGQFIGVGVIALIIVFQQEIRRFLIFIGTRYLTNFGFSFEKMFSFTKESAPKLRIRSIIKACKTFMDTRTGALIVIARKSELLPYIQTGDLVDAETSSRLMESIFCRESPLHDGAIIIIDERIKAARCILPVSETINLPPECGMRHRAALGMAEQTDAIVIIVSEEKGMLSLADTGEIHLNITIEKLKETLEKEFFDDPYKGLLS